MRIPQTRCKPRFPGLECISRLEYFVQRWNSAPTLLFWVSRSGPSYLPALARLPGFVLGSVFLKTSHYKLRHNSYPRGRAEPVFQANAGKGKNARYVDSHSLTPESSWRVPRPSCQTPELHSRVWNLAPSPGPPRARSPVSEPSRTLRDERSESGSAEILINPAASTPIRIHPAQLSSGSVHLPFTWLGKGTVFFFGLPRS